MLQISNLNGQTNEHKGTSSQVRYKSYNYSPLQQVPQANAKQLAYPKGKAQMERKGAASGTFGASLLYFLIESIGPQRDTTDTKKWSEYKNPDPTLRQSSPKM